MVGPLDGIKVLELTSVIAGPTAGWLLGALGAEVIKVEAPISITREMHDGAPAHFVSLNRNKRSIAVDLKTVEGKEIFYKMVQQSDVLVENLGPGVMDRLGFSYEKLKELNPRFVYSSIKGYGAGPCQNKLGYDMAMQAEMGLMYMTGSEDRPMRIGTSAVDMSSAIFLCLGIVLALKDREVSNEGNYIECDLFETASFLMNYVFSQTQVLGKSPPPLNTPGLWWPIYDVFTSADNKRIVVGVTSDAQWSRFCQEFDLKELLGDRFATHAKRMKERPYIIPLTAKIISKFSRDELVKKLERCDVVCACVNTPLEALAHPQLKAPNKMCKVSYTGLDKPIKLPAIPLSMEGFFPPTTATAPELGANTDEILCGLGYSEDEVEQLMQKGVVKGV